MPGTLKEIAKSRSDIFYVDPHDLQVKANWNCRDLNEPDNSQHVMDLARSISEVGVLTPLVVFREGDKIYVSDGHCRLAATMYAIHTLGKPIEAVPVRTEGRQANEADYVLRQLLDGKPKTSAEQGQIFKRLLQFGWSVEKISAQSGKSVASINSALDLQGAAPEIQKAVASGRIAPTTAIKIIRQEGSNAVQAVNDALDNATKRGSDRATARDVGGKSKVRGSNKLARIAEIIERSSIEDFQAYPGKTVIIMTDADWRVVQEVLDI